MSESGPPFSNRSLVCWFVLEALANDDDPAAALDLLRAAVAETAPQNLDLVPHLEPDAPLPDPRPPKPQPWWLLLDQDTADV